VPPGRTGPRGVVLDSPALYLSRFCAGLGGRLPTKTPRTGNDSTSVIKGGRKGIATEAFLHHSPRTVGINSLPIHCVGLYPTLHPKIIHRGGPDSAPPPEQAPEAGTGPGPANFSLGGPREKDHSLLTLRNPPVYPPEKP